MWMQGSKTSHLHPVLQPVFSSPSKARRSAGDADGLRSAAPGLQPLNPHIFERLPNPNLLTADSSSDDEGPPTGSRNEADDGPAAFGGSGSSGTSLPLSSDGVSGRSHAATDGSHEAAQDAQLMSQVSSASGMPSWPCPESPQRPVARGAQRGAPAFRGTLIGGGRGRGRAGPAQPAVFAPAFLAMDAAPGSLSALSAPPGAPASPRSQGPRQGLPAPMWCSPVKRPTDAQNGLVSGLPQPSKDRGGALHLHAALARLERGAPVQLPERAIVDQALLALQVCFYPSDARVMEGRIFDQ